MHFDASRFFHFPCSCKTLWVESLLGSFVTGSVRPCHKYPNSPSDVALWSLSIDFPNNCKRWEYKKYWEERGRRRRSHATPGDILVISLIDWLPAKSGIGSDPESRLPAMPIKRTRSKTGRLQLQLSQRSIAKTAQFQ